MIYLLLGIIASVGILASYHFFVVLPTQQKLTAENDEKMIYYLKTITTEVEKIKEVKDAMIGLGEALNQSILGQNRKN